MKSKLLFAVFLGVIATPLLVSAFTPLVGIPGVSDPESTGFNSYINTLYAISISVAGLLAVIKIIVAGVKWMLSDVVTSKQDAKEEIKGALIGLLIVVSAVLILYQINPELTTSNIVTSPVDRVSGSPLSGGGGATSPLPSGPVATKTYTCSSLGVTEGGLSKGWDCGAAEIKCKATSGTPSITGGGSIVSCAPPTAPATCTTFYDADGNVAGCI